MADVVDLGLPCLLKNIFPQSRLIIDAHLVKRIVKVLLSLLQNVRINIPSLFPNLIELYVQKLMILRVAITPRIIDPDVIPCIDQFVAYGISFV